MLRKTALRFLLAVVCFAALSAVPLGSGPIGVAMAAQSESTHDVIVFRNGKQIEGKVVSETDTKVVFEGKINGITTRTEFERADILAIRREVPSDDQPTFEAVESEPGFSVDPIDNPDAPALVYVLNFSGEFGRDIAPTPIRNSMRDAKKYEPDVIVVVVDNDWHKGLFRQGMKENDAPNDWGMFDEFSLADEIEPFLTENVEQEWSKQPRLVFWVKQAMGGAAFIPFWSSEMYFAPDGRLGGIGFLDRQFGSMGDEVVRQKQYSLRMGRAEGMAIQSGYDPKIIRALALAEYVLSYELVGGEPVYYERTPEGDGEILLTDDASEANEDTIDVLARGEGNDVLTLHAELAKTLGVSKGTVDSLDDLMYELGIHRNYQIVDGRSDRIMSQWQGGAKSAVREIPRLLRDYNEIQVVGESSRERNQARSRQISKINEIMKLLKRYEGAVVPRRYGFPDINQLEAQISAIKLDIIADRD